MRFQPRIFTFYSYKGGVGRSMALLNMAYYLQARGRHVLIVDLDLEAPGASGFLHRSDELLPRESKGDVVDVLQKVVDAVKQTPAGSEPQLPALKLEDYLGSVRPEKYATAVHPKAPRARLDVLGAEQGPDYTARYSALELSSLNADQVADASDLLRGLLIQHSFPFHQPWQEEGAAPEPTHYDYILVDSRTGLSEIGGLCVGPLSDRLIVLCGLNDQNITGTRQFMDVVGLKPEVRPINAEAYDDADPPAEDGLRPATLGPKPTLLVASPVPGGEMTYKKQRLAVLERRLGMAPAKLSYHPHMALMETIFVRDHEDEYLALEYVTLAQRVMSLVGDAEQQLKAAIHRQLARSRGKKWEKTDVLALKQWMARSALAGGQPDFGMVSYQMSHLELSHGAQDEIRRLQINLALTDEQAAKLWLEWADTLDTKEAQKNGNTAVLQAIEEKHQRAITLRPRFSQAYYNWGITLSDWAKTQEGTAAEALFAQACEKYQQATTLQPDNSDAFIRWGIALSDWAKMQEGTAAEALLAQASEKYQHATILKPDDVSAFNNWGIVLSQWAQTQEGSKAETLFDAAEEKYQKALMIKLGDDDVLFNLGCLAGLRGDVEKTVAALERWKAANPKASKTEVDKDRDFDRVRNDPLFKAFRDGLASESKRRN